MGEGVIERREHIQVGRPIPRETVQTVERGYLVDCTESHCQWQGLFPDPDLAAEAAERHYDHERRNGRCHYGVVTYTVVELLDGGTACMLDESSLGLTVEENRVRAADGDAREVEFPRTTGDLSEIVHRGDRIRLPAGREGKVHQVSETRSSGLPTWTVVYVDPDVSLTDARKKDFYWQNELVTRDGQIYRSFGRDPLAQPAFEVVGQAEHQADFSEFVARADGGMPHTDRARVDVGAVLFLVATLLLLAAGLTIILGGAL